MPGLTSAHIATQVDAILRERPKAIVIAIGAAVRGMWPADITCQGRRFALRWANSTLAVRAALSQRVPADGEADGLVILTPLPLTSFNADVLARFDRGRIHAPDRWEMVQDAFQARDVDPRLRRNGWMADALLEHTPGNGYPPVPGGILDLDTAWSHLLTLLLELGEPHTDTEALLRWTVKGDGLARFARLDALVREAVGNRAGVIGGPAAAAVMACVAAGHGGHALPLGLLCRVLFDPCHAGDPDLATARGRLELFTGGHALDTVSGLAWADAAERVLERLTVEQGAGNATRWLDRADQLGRELRIGPQVSSSNVLLSGFSVRMREAADALMTLLDNGEAGGLQRLERAAEAVSAHAQTRFQPERRERLAMAVRLARWLTLPATAPATGLGCAAQRYGMDGSFIDRARRPLGRGDELAPLAAAYDQLAQRVRARRDQDTARFATLFADWCQAPDALDGIIPIEGILEKVVAPLARRAPVLLLVLDGLSLAVFRELLPALIDRGWAFSGPADQRRELLALAIAPTVTEICRASLFAGELARGDDGLERAAFVAHPALLAAVGRNRKPPVLFHKGALTDAGSNLLAGPVRATVGTADHPVVGIVYNAIDDQLKGSNQLHSRWALEDLPLLAQILHEARSSGRVVVLTADHGHVCEDGSVPAGDGDGDRWRRATGSPRKGEILLTGERVQSPSGGNRVIAAYDEKLRYGGKRNGYHGGVAPQEIVVPLAVLMPADLEVEGWEELPPVDPVWWDALPVESAPVIPSPPKRAPRRKPAGMSTLFDPAEPPMRAPLAKDWIATVLASDTYTMQRRIAGGRLPDDAEVRLVLEALAERGGRWTLTALAQRLQKPSLRLRGLLPQLRRLLNVDGYAVLSVDDMAGTVSFDRGLLETQFQL